MGVYLNPGCDGFGKSMAANMLSAYYQRGTDSGPLFEKLEISRDASYEKHLNQYNVIFLNIQSFLSSHAGGKGFDEAFLDEMQEIDRMKRSIEKAVLWDLLEAYPNFHYYDTENLPRTLMDIYKNTNIPFVFILDEWDCIFRENQNNLEVQKRYLDFIRTLLKDADIHVYSPKSVVEAMTSQTFGNYWTQTETYEALKVYIEMNFDGLKDTVTELLAGASRKVNTEKFSNDMTTFHSADDVLTLLVHLGYLAYDVTTEEVFIPNSEVSREFVNAVEGAGWSEVVAAVKASEKLLHATWKKDGASVSAGVGKDLLI